MPQVTPDFAVLKGALPKHGVNAFGLHRQERRDSSLPKITEVHANLVKEQHMNNNTDDIDRFLGIQNESSLAKPKSFNDMT